MSAPVPVIGAAAASNDVNETRRETRPKRAQPKPPADTGGGGAATKSTKKPKPPPKKTINFYPDISHKLEEETLAVALCNGCGKNEFAFMDVDDLKPTYYKPGKFVGFETAWSLTIHKMSETDKQMISSYKTTQFWRNIDLSVLTLINEQVSITEENNSCTLTDMNTVVNCITSYHLARIQDAPPGFVLFIQTIKKSFRLFFEISLADIDKSGSKHGEFVMLKSFGEYCAKFVSCHKPDKEREKTTVKTALLKCVNVFHYLQGTMATFENLGKKITTVFTMATASSTEDEIKSNIRVRDLRFFLEQYNCITEYDRIRSMRSTDLEERLSTRKTIEHTAASTPQKYMIYDGSALVPIDLLLDDIIREKFKNIFTIYSRAEGSTEDSRLKLTKMAGLIVKDKIIAHFIENKLLGFKKTGEPVDQALDLVWEELKIRMCDFVQGEGWKTMITDKKIETCDLPDIFKYLMYAVIRTNFMDCFPRISKLRLNVTELRFSAELTEELKDTYTFAGDDASMKDYQEVFTAVYDDFKNALSYFAIFLFPMKFLQMNKEVYTIFTANVMDEFKQLPQYEKNADIVIRDFLFLTFVHAGKNNLTLKEYWDKIELPVKDRVTYLVFGSDSIVIFDAEDENTPTSTAAAASGANPADNPGRTKRKAAIIHTDPTPTAQAPTDPPPSDTSPVDSNETMCTDAGDHTNEDDQRQITGISSEEMKGQAEGSMALDSLDTQESPVIGNKPNPPPPPPLGLDEQQSVTTTTTTPMSDPSSFDPPRSNAPLVEETQIQEGSFTELEPGEFSLWDTLSSQIMSREWGSHIQLDRVYNQICSAQQFGIPISNVLDFNQSKKKSVISLKHSSQLKEILTAFFQDLISVEFGRDSPESAKIMPVLCKDIDGYLSNIPYESIPLAISDITARDISARVNLSEIGMKIVYALTNRYKTEGAYDSVCRSAIENNIGVKTLILVCGMLQNVITRTGVRTVAKWSPKAIQGFIDAEVKARGLVDLPKAFGKTTRR